jgi:hypothetical protein
MSASPMPAAMPARHGAMRGKRFVTKNSYVLPCCSEITPCFIRAFCFS